MGIGHGSENVKKDRNGFGCPKRLPEAIRSAFDSALCMFQSGLRFSKVFPLSEKTAEKGPPVGFEVRLARPCAGFRVVFVFPRFFGGVNFGRFGRPEVAETRACARFRSLRNSQELTGN